MEPTSLPMLASWPAQDMRMAAIESLNKLRPLLPEEDRGNGLELGIFAMVDPKYECPFDLLRMDGWWVFAHSGDNVLERRRFQGYVVEKAYRLARYIQETNMDAVSAFQANRNRDARRYAGAIRVDYYIPELGQGLTSIIYSASGTFELGDEAFLLEFASRAPWRMAAPSVLSEIADISNNELGRKLLAA